MKKNTLLLAINLLAFSTIYSQIKTINPDAINKVGNIEVTKKAIAFRASSTSGQPITYGSGPSILRVSMIEFDLGGNIKDNNFIVPETGVYHLDASVNFIINKGDKLATDKDGKQIHPHDYFRFHFSIKKNGEDLETNTLTNMEAYSSPVLNATQAINSNFLLFKGDRITIYINSEAESNDVALLNVQKAVLSGFQVAVSDNKGSGAAPAR